MNPRSNASNPVVAAARARARALEAETLEEQLAIVRIAAPSGCESERADYLARRFQEVGLAEVSLDEVGKVRGRLASDPGGFPPVVVAAHLDTIFPAGTELAPRRCGGRIHAPGVTDNARGLAALITVARVLTELQPTTERPLWFVATVGEQGTGDLRGVKHLFRDGSRFASASAFIALDGCGVRRIVHRAIGSRRLRLSISGSGGHSWADWGAPNPLTALGGAIAAIARIELPCDPRTTLTVARAAGGASINAIPANAWLELDIRSEATASLAEVERRCVEAAAAALHGVERAVCLVLHACRLRAG